MRVLKSNRSSKYLTRGYQRALIPPLSVEGSQQQKKMATWSSLPVELKIHIGEMLFEYEGTWECKLRVHLMSNS